MSDFRQVVSQAGFVRLVEALPNAPYETVGAPLWAFGFSVGGLAVSMSVPLPERGWEAAAAELNCTHLASPDGAYAQIWHERFLEAVPLHDGGEPRRTSILGVPFLVWLFTDPNSSRRSARLCGFLDQTTVWRIDVVAPSPASLQAWLRMLASMKRIA